MTTRNYELMFIVNPQLNEESAEALIGRIKKYLEEHGAHIFKFEDRGLSRLAYTIQGQKEGHYYLVLFSFDPSEVRGFESRLRLLEGIMREMIVRLDEELEDDEAPAPSKPPEAESAPEANEDEAKDA